VLFLDPPYAARMAPRSRHDKDMSDEKAIKKANQDFHTVGKMPSSPYNNNYLSRSCYIIVIIQGKTNVGGARGV